MLTGICICTLLIVAFVVLVYVIKVNDDLRILDDRLDVLECEMRYLKEYENDRKHGDFN